MSFVHLHLHTQYSLDDSLLRIEPLMARVAELNMPAVALTDRNNLFAAVKFYRAALDYGIKPILGAEVDLEVPLMRDKSARAVLLCQSRDGYRNLCHLLSERYRREQTAIARSDLADHGEGLIVLSGGLAGDLGQAMIADNPRAAAAALEYWRQYFAGRFYLEVTRTDREHEEDFLHYALECGEKWQLPLVATNDVRFLSSDDFDAHEVRVCIRSQERVNDANRVKEFSKEQHLREESVMREAFAQHLQAIDNTEQIALRCNFQMDLGRTLLPAYPVPDGETMDDYLDRLAGEGLERRLQRLRESNQLAAAEGDYQARLQHELDVIHKTGFSGYFVIVADFVEWARAQEIPVGPGRGSGAGSLVAYALGITGLDPLHYGLLFERFLNPDRVSMPDFDIDFCNQKRDRVIDYVRERYGADSVAQIITYGTMAAKAVVRDVGRAIGAPYKYCDRIARSIPNRIDITLQEAYQESSEFQELVSHPEDTTGAHLYELALQLEGVVRNASRHAAGVVIAPGALEEYLPLYFESRQPGGAITQYDMKDIEEIGLTKFDFLGLRTLTLLHHCLSLVNARRAHRGEDPLDLDTLPLDDEKAYDLLQKASTVEVFQLESEGARDLLKRMRPDCFDDLVALMALMRPGPRGSKMDVTYIDNKRDPKKIKYLHPDLEPILAPTFGVILYQEQVMQIARDLAGYSLGETDLLRRAMGKKNPKEMAEHTERFQQGAVGHGLAAHQARKVFDLMKEFAKYGFNKSHSVAYALLAYQTAWFKARYPDAFLAAAMTSEMDNTDKLALLCREAGALRLKLEGPDINRSDSHFTVPEEGVVRYGLGAIKGVGPGLAELLVTERAGQPFAGLDDLCRRLNIRSYSEKGLRALIHAGGLDSLGASRKAMADRIQHARDHARRFQSDQDAGQESLFGSQPQAAAVEEIAPSAEGEYESRERLALEYEALGLFLSGHPFSQYESRVRPIVQCSLADVRALADAQRPYNDRNRELQIAGVVMKITRPRNGEVVFVDIEDCQDRLQVVVPEPQQVQDFQVGDLVVVRGEPRMQTHMERGERLRIRASALLSLEDVNRNQAQQVSIILNGDSDPDTVRGIKQVLQSHHGSCEVRIDHIGRPCRTHWVLGDHWKTAANEDLLRILEQVRGVESANILYSRMD